MRGRGADRRMLPALTCALVAVAFAAVPAGAAPVVTTLDATNITPHTAVVGGTVSTGGIPTEAYVDWGATPALGTLTSPLPVPDGADPVWFDDTLTGLTPGTTYHFNLVAQQGAVTAAGTPLSFTTTPEPLVTTSPATEVGWNGAFLGGTVDPMGADTPWVVEWGETAAYGQVDGFSVVGAAEPETGVSLPLIGLTPGTTYHFRLAALDENGAPAWTGADRTFTTRTEHTAAAIARSAAVEPSVVTGASWLTRPPLLTPSAIFSAPFSGFPLDGNEFAAISTGSADDVSGTLPFANRSGGGAALPERGPGAADVSILQVGLDVPAGATCLSVAFRFLTEEQPDGATPFNDAFVAELDASTWTTTASTISAPRNFAFGPSGQVVSVNGLADAPTTQAAAAGTPFDWATPILRASRSITPGPHTLFLSIFDQGDEIYDSAVLLDRLQLTSTPAAACDGSVLDDSIPLGTPRPASGTGGIPPAAAGVSGSQATGTPEPELGTRAVGAATQGTVLVTPPGGTPTRIGADAVIPLGSRVDTRKGRVRITAATGAGGGTVSSEFHGGVFVITQDRRAPVTTVLKLVEDVGLAACPRRKRANSAAGRRKRPGKRLLWGDGKGRFRTTGSYGSATVRGTKWLVEDSCAGTLVRVTRGVVEARDFARRKTVRVRAGGRYLARRRG